MVVGRNIGSGLRIESEAATQPEDWDRGDRRLAVAPKRAWHMLDCGATRGYELLAAGELRSYLDGRSRRITLASIENFIARRLAASYRGEPRAGLIEVVVRTEGQEPDNSDRATDAGKLRSNALRGDTKAAVRRRRRPASVTAAVKERAQ